MRGIGNTSVFWSPQGMRCELSPRITPKLTFFIIAMFVETLTYARLELNWFRVKKGQLFWHLTHFK